MNDPYSPLAAGHVPLTKLRLTADASARGAVRPGLPPAWVDGERRAVEYLRLSVTDRCNFRCTYCLPEQGVPYVPKDEVLAFEEVVRLVRVFVAHGVRKVRLTGGEPLLRSDLPQLVAQIAAIDGVEDLALTTNGFLLDRLAEPLFAAGLRRLNLSLDTLRADRFRAITRHGDLDRVLAGLRAAQRTGFDPIKLNVVVVRGVNDDELADLVRFGRDEGVLVRFIEYMPIGVDGFWSDETFLSADDVMRRLGQSFGVGALEGFASDVGLAGGGPARYAALTEPGAEPVRVGFVTALSHTFCGSCNRVRLTATGTLQECLAYPGALSLRDAMRGGATDETLSDLVAQALWGKGPGHQYSPVGGGARTFQAMSVTGG